MTVCLMGCLGRVEWEPYPNEGYYESIIVPRMQDDDTGDASNGTSGDEDDSDSETHMHDGQPQQAEQTGGTGSSGAAFAPPVATSSSSSSQPSSSSIVEPSTQAKSRIPAGTYRRGMIVLDDGEEIQVNNRAVWDTFAYDQSQMMSAFNKYWTNNLRNVVKHIKKWEEADLDQRRRFAAKGWTKDINHLVVQNDTTEVYNEIDPSVGWCPENLDSEPPNLNKCNPRNRAIIESRGDLMEYEGLKATFREIVIRHAENEGRVIREDDKECSAAVEAMLIEDARFQWLKESLWARRCEGAYRMEAYDELPRNEAGQPFAPPVCPWEVWEAAWNKEKEKAK